MLDELRDRGGTGRQAPDDPQPVDIGQGTVEQSDLAQLVGLVDDGRDGRADAGRRWAQGEAPGRREREGSTRIYINHS